MEFRYYVRYTISPECDEVQECCFDTPIEMFEYLKSQMDFSLDFENSIFIKPLIKPSLLQMVESKDAN